MSIRIKLTLGLIIIIILSNVLMAVITSLYVKHIYMKEVQTRVRMDLNSAREVYNNSIDQIEQVLKAISYRRKLSSPLAQEVQGELGVVLQKIFHETGLIFG